MFFLDSLISLSLLPQPKTSYSLAAISGGNFASDPITLDPNNEICLGGTS